MKRALALALAVLMMMAIFTGCGKEAAPAEAPAAEAKEEAAAPAAEAKEEAAAPAEKSDEIVKIKLVTRCGSWPDQDKVQEEMNKILREKIGVEIELGFIGLGEYDENVKTMMAGGDEMDIVFTSNFANDYYSAVAKGAFLPLDDLLKEYAPQAYANVPEKFWDAIRVDGKIYGFINYQITAGQNGLMYRPDLAEEFGFDPSTVKKVEDIEPYLAAAKAKDPSIIPLEMSKDGIFSWLKNYYGFDQIGDKTMPGTVRFGEEKLTVTNIFASPEFEEHCKLMRDWYQKGYFIADAATFTSLADQRKTGRIAAAINPIKPGIEAEITVNYANPMKVVPLDTPVATTTNCTNTMNAIMRTCKHPEKAMQLLELLNTDVELNNLLNFGIEGVHYKKVSDNQIELLPDSGYQPNRAWTFETAFLSYYLPGQETDIWEQTKKMNEEAVCAPTVGFTFNPEKVSSEIAQCASVYEEFAPSLITGSVDPAEVLPQFLEKLNAAGAEKIIAEEQAQLDAWLASK